MDYTKICYYEILEVSKSSTKSEIKKAFRKMAQKYHPDRNPGDKEAEERFKAINEAYQILSDDEKRAIYDRYGKEAFQNGGSSSRGGFGGMDLNDIFEEFFNFGGTSNRKRRKTYNYDLDLQIEYTIEFNEAIFGTKKNIKYKYKKACDSCGGNGAKNGKMGVCPECRGDGEIHIKQGFMIFSQTCPRCQGSGESASEKCDKCFGKGYKEFEDSIEINIPEGVDSGNRIRVAGKGNIAPNGSRGDLYILLRVKDDSHFIRHGDDIYVELPIFFTKIALGATLKVQAIKDEVELNIPAGTKDKTQFTFRGKGVKNVNSNRYGDFIVQIKIEYPKSLTNEQRELLEKLQDSFGIDSQPHKGLLDNLMDKVKGWFS